jgi:HEAT repeat protein
MLNDSDADVRQAAANALDALEALTDLEQLLKRFEQGERGERIAAAYALGRVNSTKVFPPLLAALKSDDPDLRLVVVKVLGEKQHPKTLAALVKLLDDLEPGIQAETATALAGFADRRLINCLAPLLKRDQQVALAALETIGSLGFPEGEAPLLEALRDERKEIRLKAAEMLGRLPV